ncbi:unnamed protein product, partial [marine sediment metagenome]
AGGGALNACLRELLGRRLGVELTVPDRPQTVGALGAALIARGSPLTTPCLDPGVTMRHAPRTATPLASPHPSAYNMPLLT